jgi:hypothetical protein
MKKVGRLLFFIFVILFVIGQIMIGLQSESELEEESAEAAAM